MKIAIIGVGAMGGALAQGFLRSGKMAADDLWLANPHTERLKGMAQAGAHLTTDNVQAVREAQVVLLCVKPWLAEQVLEEIKPALEAGRHTLVSVVAGLAGERLAGLVERDGQMPDTLLCLPNTAAAVGQSMTFVVPVTATQERVAQVEQLLSAVGQVMLTEERLLPAGMALASCGIAYAMRYARAATEGGVELGIKATDALRVVLQTMTGAAALISNNGSNPEAEIDKVTTPGGFTIKGLNEMEHAGFSSAVIRGLKASVK